MKSDISDRVRSHVLHYRFLMYNHLSGHGYTSLCRIDPLTWDDKEIQTKVPKISEHKMLKGTQHRRRKKESRTIPSCMCLEACH